MRRLGEDTSEILEYVPASFRVVRHVRPKLACSRCDRIVQSEAPSRPIARGLAGPGLLAHVLVAKYADHLPLYRQSEIYAREGVALERSRPDRQLARRRRPARLAQGSLVSRLRLLSAKALLDIVRAHWSIEYSLHWCSTSCSTRMPVAPARITRPRTSPPSGGLPSTSSGPRRAPNASATKCYRPIGRTTSCSPLSPICDSPMLTPDNTMPFVPFIL